MRLLAANHRPFGSTGLFVPPIAFRSEILHDRQHVLTDQRKRVICAEWFAQVAPPVVIEATAGEDGDEELTRLGRILRHLEVAADDVVINLALLTKSTKPLIPLEGDQIRRRVDAASESLGAYSPRLVTLDGVDSSPLADAAETMHYLAELKTAGRIAGIGVRCGDWRFANRLSESVRPDFVSLVGSFTVMRHPPELVEILTRFADRQIAVVAAGVFHGGFLVGGARFDGRVIGSDDPADRSLLAWRKSFTSLCHGHGVRPAQACIQYALSAPSVAAVSLRTSHAERVAENVESVVTPVPNGLWQSMKEEGLLDAI